MIKVLNERINTLLNNSNNDNEAQKKYFLIKTLLNDDDCFFKIPIEIAFSILSDLGYNEEESTAIYNKLISSDNYKYKPNN
jgi:hypothetical protein